MFDEGISWVQQSKIIALETYLTPRTLSDQEADMIFSHISPVAKSIDKSHISYAFVGSTEEEEILAIQLSDKVLTKLGWEWKDWPTDIWPKSENKLPVQQKLVGSFPMSGIEIDALDPSLIEVDQSLVKSLQDTGLRSVRENSVVEASLLQHGVKQMMILIMIGAKPAPDFSHTKG